MRKIAESVIRKEFFQYQDDDEITFAVDQEDDDFFHLRISYIPPENTPYEGIFFITMILNDNYPKSRPQVKFETKIYHPSIDVDGTVCCCYLDYRWKPGNTIKDMIDIIDSLLKNPSVRCERVPSIEREYYSDPQKFEKTAREWTKKYAV